MTHTAAEQTPVEASAASEAGPSVHTQETKTCFVSQSAYRAFLVSGQKSTIEFHRALYEHIDIRDGKNRVRAFDDCRNSAWFVRHKLTGKVKVASQRCNLRWCPLCIKTKRFVMRASIMPWIKSHKKPKFITLTLRHYDGELAEQLNRIYDCFKKLRNSVLWKKHIKGGLWFFQVKKSETDGCWHPHIHCICEGKFLPHKSLKAQWLKITKDSEIVDIRAVRDPKKAADYVARYATSPAEMSEMTLDEAAAVFDSLAGRRLCGTFGTGKEIQLVPKKCPDADDWEYLGTYQYVADYRLTDPDCAKIWFAFNQGTPCDAVMVEDEPPPEEQAGLLDEDPSTFKQMVINWNNFYLPERPDDGIPF